MKKHLPIFILILLNVLIGIAIVQAYGESSDESGIFAYGEESLQAYSNLFKTDIQTNLAKLNSVGGIPRNANDYGPAYAMVTILLANGLHAIIPAWSHIDGWHFSEFISFQVGILSLYFLSRKWMGGWAAFGTALLFSTQPLLWGHAFINPKDTPFLAFFLASVTLGIYMVDALPASLDPNAGQRPDTWSPRRLMDEAGHASSSLKKIISALLIIYLLPTYFMITGISNGLVRMVITYFYRADKTSRLGQWFARLATNADRLPLDNYVHKAQAILFRWQIDYILAGLLIGILIFPWIFPQYFRRFVRQGLVPFPRRTMGLFLNPMVLAAGLVLGFTTSIRIAGPYAGILVMLYAISKSWRKATLLVIPYASIAILTSFLTWPYLWGGPINRFIESVTLMSNYPLQEYILFQGVHFPPNDLPRYFLPYLMSVQLTEVVPFLFLIGLVLLVWNLFKGHQVELFLLTITWLVVPILFVIFNRSTIYDNFRQYLFLLPPIFITGGIALEAFLKRIKWNPLRVLILCALIAPGVYADINLHPYQYVYYNSFVGGVRGANHWYELDYWSTSYREAALYINANAPKNAVIAVMNPVSDFQNYARTDLTITSLGNPRSGAPYNYIVANNRTDLVQSVCEAGKTIKTIGLDGAVFAVIKIPPASEISGCR